MIKIAVYIEKFVAYVDLRLAERRGSDVTQLPRAVVDRAAGSRTRRCAQAPQTPCRRFPINRLPGEASSSAASFRRQAPQLFYSTSNSPAAPIPPPTHMVTTTQRTPRLLPSISAWPTMRAPDIP